MSDLNRWVRQLLPEIARAITGSFGIFDQLRSLAFEGVSACSFAIVRSNTPMALYFSYYNGSSFSRSSAAVYLAVSDTVNLAKNPIQDFAQDPYMKRSGHLHTYRFCDNVWTFILQNAYFKNEECQDHVGSLKIVACDAKLLTQ